MLVRCPASLQSVFLFAEKFKVGIMKLYTKTSLIEVRFEICC